MHLTPFIVCALQDVYDPEVGVNIVDLGLVYGVDEAPNGDVHIQMTLTHRRCPLQGYITGMAEAVVRQSVVGVHDVDIELVWDPPWSTDMVNDTAKQRLVHT